jgi:hypothetical protein
MRLEKRLAACGYEGDPSEFERTVLAVYRDEFGDATPDELLLHPSAQALPLVNRVRRSLGCNLPEDLILRALLNARKQGRLLSAN